MNIFSLLIEAEAELKRSSNPAKKIELEKELSEIEKMLRDILEGKDK